MGDDPRVEELLDRLLDSDATPEEVCGSCVELLPVVRDRWREVCRAREELDVLFPPAGLSDTGFYPSPGEADLPSVPGYEVEALLGCGGMGVVFRARHLRLNRVVAMKMALAGVYARPHDRARFQREAEAVAALRHPNVVQVHDVGEAGGRPYFTMEYVDGGGLDGKLAGTPLPSREAAALVATLAGAVDAAHRAGIVHRDLKPANVLLTADGTPKVSDFGLARRVGGGAGLTRSGTALGTPSYMAPEQARGQAGAADPAADVYSLGAILYECLTGRPPFRAETASETVYQLLSQDPVPPSRLNRTVPRDLETVCLKCLQKEPRLRYATAAALADDLDRFLRGEPTAARPVGPAARLARRVRRQPLPAAAVAVATLSTVALIVGGAWTLSERASASRAAAAGRAATDRAADDDLTEMAGLLQKSSWPEARAAMERARGRLGDGGPAELRDRLARAAGELRLATRLDEVRLGLSVSTGGAMNYAQCDRDYAEAFRDAGLGQFPDDPAAVADRVRTSDIQAALVAALDHWSDIARERACKEWVLDVARRVERDPTAWRVRARDPAVRANPTSLAKLIETAPVTQESASLLLALAAADLPLTGQQRISFLERVVQAHPGDFWANLTLGYVLRENDRLAEAMRYFQAATAIRPGVVAGHYNLGLVLMNLRDDRASDRLAEAAEQLRRAVAIDPASAANRLSLGNVLALQGRYDEAVEQLDVGIRLDPRGALLHAERGICLEAKNRLAEAEAEHQRAIALDPKNREIRKEYREFLVRRGRWGEARAAWRAALDAEPREHGDWYGYAELCLFLGRQDEYCRARADLLSKFGAARDPIVAERVGRACLLLPAAGEDLRRAADLADRAAAADRRRYQTYYPAFRFAQGLADYRRGRFERAIDAMRGDAARVPAPSPRLVLAMALHRTGKPAEARKALAEAVLAHDWRAGRVKDQDDWIYHTLRREAERMILPNLPAFLAGEYRPRDHDERVALLAACQFANRTRAVAGLYSEIFAADPRLADDFRFGHRYNAACTAAQAGCGRGADAAGLGDLERASWRSRAREWLRADLAAWGSESGGDPTSARSNVRQRLTNWQTDPDLACLRDASELAKLPTDERADCVALWNEVSERVKRTAGGK